MDRQLDHRDEGICLYASCDGPVPDGITVQLCEKHLGLAFAAHLIHTGMRAPEPRPQPPVRPNRAGTVYYVRVGDLIKIGWTANPKQRFNNLHADAVLFTFPGTRREERAEQARWWQQLHHGKEWFTPSREMNDYIRQQQSTA